LQPWSDEKSANTGAHQQQIAEIVNMKLRYQRRLLNAKTFRIEVCADDSSIPMSKEFKSPVLRPPAPPEASVASVIDDWRTIS
jgi:hypothetical protein